MSKKTILQGGIALVVVILLGVVLYFTLGNPTVDTSQVTYGVAYGINSETGSVSDAELSSQDVDKVAAIFNEKEKSYKSPGDIFSEDCAFVLSDGDSDQYFCIALDDSNYVCSANDDMYFEISSDEKSTLKHLLSEYCGYRG